MIVDFILQIVDDVVDGIIIGAAVFGTYKTLEKGPKQASKDFFNRFSKRKEVEDPEEEEKPKSKRKVFATHQKEPDEVVPPEK